VANRRQIEPRRPALGFVENFEVLAEAQGGIKRLRELVLDLAARGARPTWC